MNELERKIIQINSYKSPVDNICRGIFSYQHDTMKYCELPDLVGKVDCKYLTKNMNDNYCMHQNIYK